MASAQKPFYIALTVIAVGGVAFIVSRMSGPKAIAIPANVVVTAADTTGFRGYLIGSPDAPVEITEYGDFQCPSCANFDQVQYPDLYTRAIAPGKARFRFRDFPLDGIHPHTRIASHAAACAEEQHRFVPMKDGLFARQNDWAFTKNPMGVFTEIVRSTGADVGAWNSCMESKKFAGRIQASLDEGNAVGVRSTPSFLINGQIYNSISSEQMIKLVDSLVAASPRPAPAPAKPLGGQ